MRFTRNYLVNSSRIPVGIVPAKDIFIRVTRPNSLNCLPWLISTIHHFASTGMDDIVLGQ